MPFVSRVLTAYFQDAADKDSLEPLTSVSILTEHLDDHEYRFYSSPGVIQYRIQKINHNVCE